MQSIPQNYEQLLLKVIFNNFNNIISKRKVSDNKVFNYINILNTLDDSLCNIAIKSLESLFFSIDNGFKNSPERKHMYHIKAHNTRTMMTIFGEITYHKTIYENKFTHEYFCYIDDFLGLPKYDYFDPYIKSCILDYSSKYPYSQVATMMNDLVNKKINIEETKKIITRQTIRNIILNSTLSKENLKELETPESIYIMADEKFIATQNNKHNDAMIKSIVIFDGREIKDGRTILKNKRVFADYETNCVEQSLDYLYYVYDIDKIKNVYVMGDGASWIKNITQHYFFNPKVNLSFNLDGFHFNQAINNITTTKEIEMRDSLLDLVMNDDKDLFKETCLTFMDKHQSRSDTIINKMEYVLNNWKYIKNLYNQKLKCPMESQISHNIAALFSSRPKAYSLKVLKKLLNIRLLKINKNNIKLLFLNNINKKDVQVIETEHLNCEIISKPTGHNIDKELIPIDYYPAIM